jgi:protein-S-isoprenylcysteine O-methyltransferase Ste14
MAHRLATAAYALTAYAAFLASVLWAAAFLLRAGAAHGVDGVPATAWPKAAGVDLGLLGLFALQHTLMARAAVKRRMARIVPRALERSTFVLLASLLLLATFALWQPIGGTVWNVQAAAGRAAVLAVYAAGWVIVVASTFMTDHLELFGLRQAHAALTGRTLLPGGFKERWFYAWVRHPMMSGFVVVVWASPRMTVGHVLFAAASSAYIAVGLAFEERDLRRRLGATYDDYRRRVPMLVPRPRLRRTAGALASARLDAAE